MVWSGHAPSRDTKSLKVNNNDGHYFMRANFVRAASKMDSSPIEVFYPLSYFSYMNVSLLIQYQPCPLQFYEFQQLDTALVTKHYHDYSTI